MGWGGGIRVHVKLKKKIFNIILKSRVFSIIASIIEKLLRMFRILHSHWWEFCCINMNFRINLTPFISISRDRNIR